MRSSILATLFTAIFLIGQGNATYVLDTVMWGSTFFSNFNFQTVDPNNGYVNYLTQTAAQSAGLISQANGAPAKISADSTQTLSGSLPGRQSVRIESKKTWTHGLYVFNLASVPSQACGLWPAMWLVGANWPNNGEIDVLEGISMQTNNLMSLHTSNGCTVAQQTELGAFQGGNCYGGASNNQGCGVSGTANTFGTGLNSVNGGSYVLEWTSAFIKIWWYPKASIPTDIANGAPDQTKRGEPLGYWLGSGSCNIDSKFNAMQIIMNINFCGDWGNAIWAGDSACSAKASTCAQYVAKNPTAFANAKFEVNSIKVYQQKTSGKRGIPDPSLEWERSLLNVTEPADLAQEQDILVEARDADAAPAKAHLHRHRHRSERNLF